jgi:hypothetical protein
MKKAKLMLAGIACLAVVGGAFAFKANRSAAFYFTKNAAGTACVFSTLVNTNATAPIRTSVYTTNVNPTTTILPITFCTQTAKVVPEV